MTKKHLTLVIGVGGIHVAFGGGLQVAPEPLVDFSAVAEGVASEILSTFIQACVDIEHTGEDCFNLTSLPVSVSVFTRKQSGKR